MSLPVASVILAVETGSEDDPADMPGLVHALAFHGLQGNRELAPGGATRLVHDAGGVSGLAFGPGQIRYESVVPMSHLDETIWVESQRFRAPTISKPLWTVTLRQARRDPDRAWTIPLEALAAAHGAPGLGHEGREVSEALSGMVERAIAIQMADRMRYTAATLVVVAPVEPEELLARIRKAFADLPAASRKVRERTVPTRQGDEQQNAFQSM